MFSIFNPDFTQYRTDLLADVFPLAVDLDGREVDWIPQVRNPHIFIGGPVGSGKTTTAENLVIQACRNGWDVHVLRQFGREYREFEDWPGVKIASTPPEHGSLLSDTDTAGKNLAPSPVPVLVVIDTTELLADIGNGGLDHLLNLVNRPQSRRINLVLISTPASPDFVPAVTRQLHHIELARPPKWLEPRLPHEVSRWRPGDRPA
ncbi:ATP-binding protein [Mycolicibacterium sphagni]|uniref:ATP-binding protein n=1 Tax=Mycolicibacterium sphagni TaxID=1786 RepID=A0ABX2K4H2_9MYCO|nr:ATP-binding protein [Mycolicibacterium sphagni]NTY62642.1 ATP-binding protein [Mycolicibacterium sphagni]